jgi:hypothetical protein
MGERELDVVGIEVGPQSQRNAEAIQRLRERQFHATRRGDEQTQVAAQPQHALAGGDLATYRRGPGPAAALLSAPEAAVLLRHEQIPTAGARPEDAVAEALRRRFHMGFLDEAVIVVMSVSLILDMDGKVAPRLTVLAP